MPRIPRPHTRDTISVTPIRHSDTRWTILRYNTGPPLAAPLLILLRWLLTGGPYSSESLRTLDVCGTSSDSHGTLDEVF